jgi:hypothetical protein
MSATKTAGSEHKNHTCLTPTYPKGGRTKIQGKRRLQISGTKVVAAIALSMAMTNAVPVFQIDDAPWPH